MDIGTQEFWMCKYEGNCFFDKWGKRKYVIGFIYLRI